MAEPTNTTEPKVDVKPTQPTQPARAPLSGNIPVAPTPPTVGERVTTALDKRDYQEAIKIIDDAVLTLIASPATSVTTITDIIKRAARNPQFVSSGAYTSIGSGNPQLSNNQALRTVAFVVSTIGACAMRAKTQVPVATQVSVTNVGVTQPELNVALQGIINQLS